MILIVLYERLTLVIRFKFLVNTTIVSNLFKIIKILHFTASLRR